MIRAFALIAVILMQLSILLAVIADATWLFVVALAFAWQFAYWGAALNQQAARRKLGLA